jgi:hypothetical protein
MLEKLREILLTQYIGSILVALLACNAVITLTTYLLQAAIWVFNDQRTRSVLGSSHPAYPWDNLVYSAATIILYLLTAYFLARWLYEGTAATTDAPSGEPPADEEGIS